MTSAPVEPSDRPTPAPRLPSRSDPMAWRAVRTLGGSWGRHAGVSRRSWWTPLRWLLAMTLATLILGVLQKAPCADGDWAGSKQYTHFCYSDVVPLWSNERLDVGGVPYRDTKVEYPVLTGAFMWLTAEFTRGATSLVSDWSQLVVFGALTMLLLALCGLVVTAATAQTARGRPWDAAIFALSPLLVFHAFSNWDLLAMAFASGALWAWARGKPVLAGALIGLGAAAKLYPVFLLVAIAILAVRTGKFRDATWTVAAAAAAWLAVNVPVAMAYYDGWWEFYTFSQERTTERSTFWAIGRTLTDGSFSDQDAPAWVPPGVAVAALLLVALAVVAWLCLAAPTRPRLAQVAFLCVLAFILTTKVWSPQYSLWLVPLLALARPRWRLNLIWQFVEVAVWMLTLTLLLGYSVPAHGISYGWLVLVILVRDVLLLVLAGLIVREMWCPWLDVVRVDGADDPGGGVFDGAPDAPWRQPVAVAAGPAGGPDDPDGPPASPQIDVRK